MFFSSVFSFILEYMNYYAKATFCDYVIYFCKHTVFILSCLSYIAPYNFLKYIFIVCFSPIIIVFVFFIRNLEIIDGFLMSFNFKTLIRLTINTISIFHLLITLDEFNLKNYTKKIITYLEFYFICEILSYNS